MSIEQWTLLIAVITSVACSLCGSLLVVNRKAMVTEGLSHAVVPGLVIAFLIFRDYSSPWLILSAAFSGLVMVAITQWLQRTRLVDSDAALGIAFSGMFSIGILLVSLKLRNTHFHTDCIIDGNLALAPLNRLKIGDTDLGPRSWIVMSTMLVLVIGFISLCYKELKLSIFDPLLAERFRLRPSLLQLLTIGLVSLTTVAAFNVAGSILIVALMIAPPAAAYLLTSRLSSLFVVSTVLAIVSSVTGFYLALHIDISPTGPIASCSGLAFLAVLLLAPRRGLLATSLKHRQQEWQVKRLLLLELVSQNTLDSGSEQKGGSFFNSTLNAAAWTDQEIKSMLQSLYQEQLIHDNGDELQVTDSGRQKLQAKIESL